MVEAARCGAWAGGTGGPALAELAASEDPDPYGVRVRAVRVVGPLDLDHLTATVPLVLRACVIPEPVTCRNARLRELDLSGSALTILAAEGASVDDGLPLQDIEVRGADDNGAVRLSRARIGGHVSLERAQVVNDFGPGVHAVSLRVDGDLVLSGAVVRGCGEFGALRLLGTRVDGTAGLEGIHCANNSGPGLTADHLHVDGGLFLTGAVVRGSGEKGALRLPGADLRGQLVLENARVDNPSGPLLVLIETQVAEALVLPASLVCPHSKALRAGRPCPGRDRQIIVQCLVFARLAEVSWQKWLHLLVEHTPDYVPQPFQQLAAVKRTAGHDANAREILLVQQDQLRRWAAQGVGRPVGATGLRSRCDLDTGTRRGSCSPSCCGCCRTRCGPWRP
ncbi:hypothetical protein CNX65_17095 [Actinosynnema pretiosum]|uniref:Membrane-associated oxidoreductase n=1 Tax=Actinosynnema pretiosum TaxID=42197 RepID=A0A290Z735_9PSEU|nr:hypothetical protein CNX65_17095 [Actinosynnema pretiosum]